MVAAIISQSSVGCIVDEKSISVVFGKQVRVYRKSRRMTQKQLAAAAGKTVDTVSNIERGTYSTNIDTAYRIANAVGVELWELLRFPALSAEEEKKRHLLDRFLDLINTKDTTTKYP